MEDNLFDDLLASAEEMVAIESGNVQATVTREYQRPDSKRIRKSLHLKQDEFAAAIGVSTSLVQSWEQQRRYPDGASLKLLRLLEAKPEIITQLQAV